MNIQKHFSISTNPKELQSYVSSFLSNADKISQAQIQHDFYKIDTQKIIDILSQDPSTNTLATILTSIKNQLIILGTNQQLENIISTTKNWLSVILISTPEPFFSRFFSKPSLNSFMKSVSLLLMAHLNQMIQPQKLYQLIEKILDHNTKFFTEKNKQDLTKEEIANKLLLYYYNNPENLQAYLDYLFATNKYYPTPEEVDSNKTIKGRFQDFKDSLFGRAFDQKIKNQIFQAVANQAKNLFHYLEYQSELSFFFTENWNFQQKESSFETCMYILKEKNQKFQDISLDQFIEELKKMYSESPTDFKNFLKQYFYENVAFYDQDLIEKTYQMTKNITEQELQDAEIDLNNRISLIKYDNTVLSSMDNKELKQALFQISQQDQKENTEKLKGILVQLIPNAPDKNDYINDTSQLIKFLSNKTYQQAA